MSKKDLFNSSLLLALSSLISRGLGVWRDHLFSTTFGANGTGIYSLDTYYAAFRIPDLLYSILIYGTISVAFMPIFSEHLAQKKYEDAWKFTSNVLNLLLVIFLIIAGVIFLFAKNLLNLFVSGFSPTQIEQTVTLVRIMLLSPLFFSIAAIAIGVENSFQKFIAQAWAPVLYNLGIIGGCFLWGQNFGVYGLVWGVVLGALAYMLIQLPGLIQTGFRWFPLFSWQRADTRKMFKLVLPRIIGLSAMQINLLVDTFLASSLVAGSLTILNLAQNLQSLPFGIISISLAITSFSLFTKLAAEKNWEKFRNELQNSIRQTLFLLLPATLGMYLLKDNIVSLVLEGGAFGETSAKMTSEVLSYFLIALLAQGLIPLLARAFFALQNTLFPLSISLIAMLVNVCASFYLSGKMAVNGLALANALGMWINMSLLYYFLTKKFGTVVSVDFLIRIFLSVSLMGGVILLLQNYFIPAANGLGEHFLKIGLLTIGGGITYLGLTHLLGLKESKNVVRRLLKK